MDHYRLDYEECSRKKGERRYTMHKNKRERHTSREPPEPTLKKIPRHTVLYPKPSPKSFVQRTSKHEHSFSVPHPPGSDMSDTRGKVASSNSAPPLDRRETGVISPSATVSTQTLVRVCSSNNGNSTVSSTNPLSGPPSLSSDS